ncbi:EG45-like domain containing protein [Humulus lupulus]|uniref:EG45-like domain containing protein n=1 Tax=Humulus lupulus TaxID=3486 RepID=UPI002B40559F|nr:EG45-like domain containing protein [Humulus lupulus]
MRMEIESRVLLIVLGTLICLSSVAHAASGTATFYTPPYVPSSCYGFQDNGVMIAAASDVLWNNREACGKRYRIECTGATNQGVPRPCTGQSVVVQIVDYCPPGCAGTIDLSSEAFSIIANPDAGKVMITYTQV